MLPCTKMPLMCKALCLYILWLCRVTGGDLCRCLDIYADRTMIKQVDLAAQASANVHTWTHTLTQMETADKIGLDFLLTGKWLLSFPVSFSFLSDIFPPSVHQILCLFIFSIHLCFSQFSVYWFFFTVHLFGERPILLRHSNIIVHMKDTNNTLWQPFFFLFHKSMFIFIFFEKVYLHIGGLFYIFP